MATNDHLRISGLEESFAISNLLKSTICSPRFPKRADIRRQHSARRPLEEQIKLRAHCEVA
jgi:hypothetical protein